MVDLVFHLMFISKYKYNERLFKIAWKIITVNGNQ